MKDKSKCTDEELKRQIYEKARDLGAELVNCCSVEKWQKIPPAEAGVLPAEHLAVVGKSNSAGDPAVRPDDRHYAVDRVPGIVHHEQ